MAATTHAPLTAMVMIFELTNDYHIILPLMISCVLASIVARWLLEESIYTMKLSRRGVNIKQGIETNLFRSIKVSEVMRPDAEVLREDMGFSELLAHVLKSHHINFSLVDEGGRLQSMVYARDLRPYIQRQRQASGLRAKDLSHPIEYWITPEDSLDMVNKAFEKGDINELPVVDSADSRRVAGMVFRRDVAAAYNEVALKQNMVWGLQTGIQLSGPAEKVNLADGVSMTEIDVPGIFVGKTVKEVGEQYSHGLQFVLIKQTKLQKGRMETRTILPKASYRFEHGDRVVIVGKQEDVNRWKDGGV